jgi:hypothetical protein
MKQPEHPASHPARRDVHDQWVDEQPEGEHDHRVSIEDETGRNRHHCPSGRQPGSLRGQSTDQENRPGHDRRSHQPYPAAASGLDAVRTGPIRHDGVTIR